MNASVKTTDVKKAVKKDKSAAKKAVVKKVAAAAKPVASKERLMGVLVAPHVSEKSARVSETANQIVFRVRGDATKSEIKAAVELMFEVKVQAVQVLNAAGKKKRFAQRLGSRSDYKKAYVRLTEGQTIDFGGAQA